MIVEGRSFSGNERHCVFLNTGSSPAAKGKFADISAVSGLDFPDDGRAVALVDWDGDGDQDMWISNRNAPRLRLMRNETPRTNHFLALRLEGNGTRTNRDAIGSRVEVILAGGESGGAGDQPRSIRGLRAGEGFLAQSSKWLHFGLGAAEVIDKVIVHWAGGSVEEFSGIGIDRRYRLIQGTAKPQAVEKSVVVSKLAPSTQGAPACSQVARVPLVELLKVPKMTYTDFGGNKKTLQPEPGRLLLVNLWASWCLPCQAELRDFSENYEELQAKGIDVLALSVDALGQDPSTRKNAARMVANDRFPFAVGEATNSLVNDLQEIHNLHLPLHEKLPLPSSFLIDRKGRVSVIYKGTVSVDTVMEDIRHSKKSRLQRYEEAAAISGKSIQHPEVERTAVASAVALRVKLGLGLQNSGLTKEAALLYEESLEMDPGSSQAHHYLGLIRHNDGREAEAIEHLGEAVRLKPDYSEAHNSFGIALLGKGEIDEAVEHFQKALQLQPGYAAAHNSLGVTFLRQKKYVDAIEQFHFALRGEPGWTETRKNLGLGLQGLATILLGQPFQVQGGQPDHATMHAALGNTHRDRNEIPEAARHYQWALNLNPVLQPALNNLAWIRATHPSAELRDGAKAVELAERCCRLSNYELGATLDTLAAAYAEAGRFEEAIRWQIKVIALASEAEKAGLEKQLKSYQAGKPLRK
ncbi:MAG: tetratricopeptide (TPR) repeat protein [Akkermansiaceae bacterium]|jgi:tetratricopeptide (TPR) repeat protein